MEKEIISSKQMINIMIIYILGSSLVMGGNTSAKQDSWISIILAVAFMIPICLVYGRLCKLHPGKNIYDMFYDCFGKIAGAILTIIFTIYAIHLGAMIIRNFTEFIQTVSLPETPQFAVAIAIGLICMWTIAEGIEILGRGAAIVMPIVFVVIVLTVIMNINNLDLSYIQPIFENSLSKILSCSLYHVSFPFGEIVLFLSVAQCMDRNTNPYRVYITALVISGTLLLVAMIRNLLVLGMPVLESLYFPSYSAVGIININEFISRIEVLVTGNFIISGLAKVCICMYAACKGIAKLFGIKKYKQFVAPVAVFMIAVSGIAFANTMEMISFLEPYRIYAPVLQIFIPLILLAVSLVRKRNNLKNTAE